MEILALIMSLLQPLLKALFEVVLTTPAIEKEVQVVETTLDTDVNINFDSSNWLLNRS